MTYREHSFQSVPRYDNTNTEETTMFLRMTQIDYDTANIIVDFGDDCFAVQHENGNVGIYVKDENDLLQISDRLIRNPSKTGEQIAREMWGK